MPTLALCMIVKDEEEMLAGCLESVQGIVDEMIVVDTGSTDNTKQIALAAGAKVFDFEWINDFGAARNFAKSKTNCDFVLSLDADERFHTPSLEHLQYELEHCTASVGMVSLTNAQTKPEDWRDLLNDSQSQRSSFVPRILVNSDDNYWVGRIHEVPSLTVNSYYSATSIVHLGALSEIRQKKSKSKRNLDLLELTLEKGEVQNPMFYSYLALERQNAGNQKGFEEAILLGWEELFRWLENEGQESKHAELSIGALSYYPLLLVLQGETNEALVAIQKVLKVLNRLSNPLNTLCMMLDSFFHSDSLQTLPTTLLEILVECVDFVIKNLDKTYFEPTLSTATPLTLNLKKLSLLLLTKNFEVFNETLASVKSEVSDSLELDLLEVEGLIEQGELIASFETWFKLVDTYGYESPDTWVLGSIILLGLNKEEEADSYLTNALQRRHNQFASPHRIRLLQSLMARMAVLTGQPYAGYGTYGVIGAVLAREPVVSVKMVPSSIIDQVVERYVETGRVEMLLRFFDPRAQHILPGVAELVTKKLSEFGFELVDDGEQDPCILIGSNLDEILGVFESAENIAVVQFTPAEVQSIKQAIDDFQTQAMEDLLMGGMNFLDEEDEGSDELTSLFQDKIKGLGAKPLVVWSPEWPVEELSDIMPSKQVVFYLGDAPQSSQDKMAFSAWSQQNQKVVEATGGKMHLKNRAHLTSNPQNTIHEIFAYMGQVVPEDMLEHVSLDSGQVRDFDEEFADSDAKEIMRLWKFIS